VRRDGVGTVTEGALPVELFDDPGHGDQSNGGGDDVDLQVAQPGQILQMGIAHKVDRHKRDDEQSARMAASHDATLPGKLRPTVISARPASQCCAIVAGSASREPVYRKTIS